MGYGERRIHAQKPINGKIVLGRLPFKKMPNANLQVKKMPVVQQPAFLEEWVLYGNF